MRMNHAALLQTDGDQCGCDRRSGRAGRSVRDFLRLPTAGRITAVGARAVPLSGPLIPLYARVAAPRPPRALGDPRRNGWGQRRLCRRRSAPHRADEPAAADGAAAARAAAPRNRMLEEGHPGTAVAQERFALPLAPHKPPARQGGAAVAGDDRGRRALPGLGGPDPRARPRLLPHSRGRRGAAIGDAGRRRRRHACVVRRAGAARGPLRGGHGRARRRRVLPDTTVHELQRLRGRDRPRPRRSGHLGRLGRPGPAPGHSGTQRLGRRFCFFGRGSSPPTLPHPLLRILRLGVGH